MTGALQGAILYVAGMQPKPQQLPVIYLASVNGCGQRTGVLSYAWVGQTPQHDSVRFSLL